jgi:ribosomal protein L32
MDIEVYDTITVAYIASMVISVIIVAIVVIFGKDIAVRVERIIPEFPELNPIIYNIAILAAIIIAYRAFEGLFIPLLDESNIMWLYPVVFLCAAILPIYRLTAVLFTSSGKIADVIVKEKKTTIGGTVVCPACGTSVVKSKFCGACGQELPQPTAASSCPKCGSALKPGARFCVYCGTEVSEPKAAPQHGDGNHS